jgi:hypothetical protein
MASQPAHDRFEALHALYDNKQQWVRHYEILLAQLIPIGTTASIVFSAYLAEKYKDITLAKQLLLIPAAIILFTSWFLAWCDAEIKAQFEQIVSAEIGMGFYDIVVRDREVLPDDYQNSPRRMRPIIIAGWASQIVSVAVLLSVAVYLFTR